MSDELLNSHPVWRRPLLCAVALLIVIFMLRLGFWQLDRAEQKRAIISQLESKISQEPANLSSLIPRILSDDLRFRPVLISGRYLVDSDIFVDNQVVNGQVGYQVFTPFKLDQSDLVVLVGRGWVSAGDSRSVLPEISTSKTQLNLEGRLNDAPAKPPLWNDKYPVSQGPVWQYLPISEVAKFLDAQVFPLVVELAPNASGSGELLIKWPAISDKAVAKHHGYAFQWFAMAAAFFIACLVLLIKSIRRN